MVEGDFCSSMVVVVMGMVAEVICNSKEVVVMVMVVEEICNSMEGEGMVMVGVVTYSNKEDVIFP